MSDRAHAGVYTDEGIPALKIWLKEALQNPIVFSEKLVPDERAEISSAILECVNNDCCLIFTTGGTGPAPRDVTPEATMDVADRILPGFGEQMRAISLHFVPTAILSRQIGATRGRSLIVNLPGQPKSIRQILSGLPDKIDGLFRSIPYAIELLGGPRIETKSEVISAFRPAGK